MRTIQPQFVTPQEYANYLYCLMIEKSWKERSVRHGSKGKRGQLPASQMCVEWSSQQSMNTDCKNTACRKTKDWTFSGANVMSCPYSLGMVTWGEKRGCVSSRIAWEYEKCISLLFIFFLLELVVFRLGVISLNRFIYFWWAFILYDLGPIRYPPLPTKVSTFCIIVNQHWKPDWFKKES